MIGFPNCKINLGLRITGKRADGYHDLQTVFYPLPCLDILEIITTAATETSLSTSGFAIDSAPEKNLCLRAYELLKKDHPSLAPVVMHLHKNIPMGAGLGGGSSDAAFVLRMLNNKFNLGLSNDQLANYALQLGSDCPFFLLNRPAYATGRGEELETINLDLSAYKFVLVHPGIHISTAEAFSSISPSAPAKSTKTIINQPISTWKDELQNDFERPIFHRHPEIAAIKKSFYDAGALYAAMSGSGSSVFGIFEEDKPVNLSFPSNYYVRELDSQLK